MASEEIRVGHYKWTWLPLSEIFVHRQVLFTPPPFEPFVYADRPIRADRFPVRRLRTLIPRDVPVPRSWIFERLWQRWWDATSLRPGRWEPIWRSDGIRLLHVHFGDNAIRVLPVIRRLNLPLVVSFYGHDASRTLVDHPESMRPVFETAARVLALSNDMANQLEAYGCPKDRLTVLRVGIDVEPGLPASHLDGSCRILMAARFVEKKGFPDAFAAFAKVRRKEPRAHLDVIGDGPMRQELVSLARRLDIHDGVRFLGEMELPALRHELRNADVFLHPSLTASNGDREGTPTILLEAQAAGLPVVATLHAGIPEIVENGRTGLLVPERDVSGLSQALEDLLASAEKRGAMGARGRRLVEQEFNATVLGGRLGEIYRQVLARNPS